MGKIKGDACGIDDKISVYKYVKQKEVMLNTLPINTINKFKNSKFGFIKHYWTRNHRNFF